MILKGLDKLQTMGQERISFLNKIASEVKDLEDTLNKGAFPFMGLEINNDTELFWRSGRLFLRIGKLTNKPLRPYIEHSSDHRELYYPYIQKFIDQIIEIGNKK